MTFALTIFLKNHRLSFQTQGAGDSLFESEKCFHLIFYAKTVTNSSNTGFFSEKWSRDMSRVLVKRILYLKMLRMTRTFYVPIFVSLPFTWSMISRIYHFLPT